MGKEKKKKLKAAHKAFLAKYKAQLTDEAVKALVTGQHNDPFDEVVIEQGDEDLGLGYVTKISKRGKRTLYRCKFYNGQIYLRDKELDRHAKKAKLAARKKRRA